MKNNANGFYALMTIVYMLRTFSTSKDFSYEWKQGSRSDEYEIIREETVYNGGDDVSGVIRNFRRERIYKIKHEELNNLTPNDIMLLYKKLHRAEFTCDTMESRG